MTLEADLVLEGGGVKGIGLVGAYSALAEAGYQVRRVAGTSAGAVVGALIAGGMPARQLEATMRTVDYRAFADHGRLDRLGMLGKGLSVLFEQGIYEGDAIHAWIDGLLGDLGVRTFGDLRYDDPGASEAPEDRYRLVIVASDVSRGRLVRFPWAYREYGIDPDQVLVADAVRASISIPFYYEPVRVSGAGPAAGTGPFWLVDGGILSNFPVDTFDRTDGLPPRWPTFGLKLSARPGAVTTERFEIDNTFDFTRALVGTMMSFHDQIHIDDPAVLARTMFIDTFGTQTTDFGLDERSRERLYAAGRAGAEKFLRRWDFGRYLEQYRS